MADAFGFRIERSMTGAVALSGQLFSQPSDEKCSKVGAYYSVMLIYVKPAFDRDCILVFQSSTELSFRYLLFLFQTLSLLIGDTYTTRSGACGPLAPTPPF